MFKFWNSCQSTMDLKCMLPVQHSTGSTGSIKTKYLYRELHQGRVMRLAKKQMLFAGLVGSVAYS